MTNVLLVLADDVRLDHLPYLPLLHERIGGRGRAFDQARCNLPLCQPQRVGLLTGQLSREHGAIEVGFDGVNMPDPALHVQAAMAAAGYRCGMFGKFVNGIDSYGGIDPPTGWSVWREYGAAPSSERFTIRRETDSVEIVGQYDAEYLYQEAAAFIRSTPEPWFAYVAPRHVHAPFAPHPDDLHSHPGVRCREVEVLDDSAKPAYVRDQAPLTAAQWAAIQDFFRGAVQEMQSLDRLVVGLIDEVDRVGATDRTVVLFTSDNGVFQGEHRRPGGGSKDGPYDVALRVPLLVSGPGFAPGPAVEAPVYAPQDVTATLLDIASAVPLLPAQAGTSLRSIVADPAAQSDRVLLHEISEGYVATGDAVTTGPAHGLGHWKLVRYPSVRQGRPIEDYELYELRDDPDELVNLAGVASHRRTRDVLEAVLDQLLAGRGA